MSIRVESPSKMIVAFVRVAIAPVFGLFVMSSGTIAAEPAPTPGPNLLMIMCDQLNAFTMGVAGCDVKTPNFDRLVREGTWFKHAACAYPLCVPSRISMAVGVYPHQRDKEPDRPCRFRRCHCPPPQSAPRVVQSND